MSQRTVIITGGGTGIGRATAEKFVEEGDRVAVVDVDGEAAREVVADLGEDVSMAVEADVSDEATTQNALDEICEHFTTPDVLVNNAGIAQKARPLNQQTVSDWQRVIDVHLRGTYIWSRLVIPLLCEQGHGEVINLSSIAGLNAFPYRTAYSPAKAAINSLTKVLAIEFAPDGISVNAVAPGYVQTEMVKNLIDNGEIDLEPLYERTPIGELATPEQIADVITFLTSDKASYITGVVLPVDGGWSAYGYV